MQMNGAKHKGGRPKLPDDQRRSFSVKVNLDKNDYDKLRGQSLTAKKPLSKVVAELAVKGYVKRPLPQGVVSNIRILAGMANNLNQLTHLGHQCGFYRVVDECERITTELSRIIIKINELL